MQSNNKKGQPILSQTVNATLALFSTETEDTATVSDGPNWASLEEEAEATSDCSKDEVPDTKVG